MRERMRDWSFSASAEWVVGILLAVAIVVTRVRVIRPRRAPPATGPCGLHYFPEPDTLSPAAR